MMDEVLGHSKRLIALFAPVAIVFILGSNIPLPGIDPDFIARQSSAGTGQATDRLSILALGLTPVLNGLAIGEICLLLFQWSLKPEIAPSSTAAWTTVLTRLVALGIAALQGYGIASGLEAAGAFNPGAWAAVPAMILTLVGSTAVLLWLSDRSRVQGLRHGVWLLWSATFFLSLPENLAGAVEATRVGAMPAGNWLLNAGYICLSVAAVVGVNLFWRNRVRGSGDGLPGHDGDLLSIFLWPIFLASYAGGYLLTILLLLAQDSLMLSQLALRVVATLTIALLIPIFVFGYARLHLKTCEDAPSKRQAIYSAAAVIAAMEIALFLLGSYLGAVADLPLSVNGVLVIVVTTTILAAIGGGPDADADRSKTAMK